jgi:hypothetical protein
MKKIVLFIIIVLSSMGVVQAQNYLNWWQKATKKWVTVSDSIFTATNQYYGPLPVSVYGTANVQITADSTASKFGAASAMYSLHDTLSTRIDSIKLSTLFSNKTWWQGDITVNDTVEVSGDVAFGVGNVTIIYPNSQPGMPIPRRYISNFPTYYIRRYVTSGGTGTVTIDIRTWGN